MTTAKAQPLFSPKATEDAQAALTAAGIAFTAADSGLRSGYQGSGVDVIETAVRLANHKDTYRTEMVLAELPGVIDTLTAFAYVSVVRRRDA